jgi:hypothetical protein
METVWVDMPDPHAVQRYVDPAQTLDYIVGLAVGESGAASAVAVVEEAAWLSSDWLEFNPAAGPPDYIPSGSAGWRSPSEIVPRQLAKLRSLNWNDGRPPHPPLAVRHLRRWRSWTGHSGVVRDVVQLLDMSPLAERRTALVMNATDVGLPLMAAFRSAGVSPVGVVVTGSNEPEPSYDAGTGGYRVPGVQVLQSLKLLLEQERLTISLSEAQARTLADELLAFDPRSSRGDTLAMAAGLACWYREFLMEHVDASMAELERAQRRGAVAAW